MEHFWIPTNGTHGNKACSLTLLLHMIETSQQNNAKQTGLLFGQRTKGDCSCVIKRPKSGTNSDECSERKIPGVFPDAGCSPTKPTNKTNPQRQLWEGCENTAAQPLSNAAAHTAALCDGQGTRSNDSLLHCSQLLTEMLLSLIALRW